MNSFIEPLLKDASSRGSKPQYEATMLLSRVNVRHLSGLTRTEVLIALAIVATALLLAWAEMTKFMRMNQMTSTVSNLKQIHLAADAMAADGISTKDQTLGWPGDIGGTFTNWMAKAVPEYLSTNDMCKLLSAPGREVPGYRLPTSLRDSAVLIYAVSSNSAVNTVFLSTANFTNGPSGGLPLLRTAEPYGNAGFVVFRKGGDGAILLKNQVTSTNLIGTYVPLLK